jgi:hypothetical protein
VTVSGPAVNASHEGHKQRDVLAREAAAGIMLAMTLAPAPPPKRVSSGYDIDMSAPGFVHHRGTPKAATTTVVHGRVVKTPARSNR